MNPARVIFPAVRWSNRTLDDVWMEVHRALDLGVGGFVVFGGDAWSMRELASRAIDHAGRPVLFAADLERGAGQQLRYATQLPPAAALSGLGAERVAEAARTTAREAAGAGIGWLLAPVADLDIEPQNPIVGTRSFGANAEKVAAVMRVWIEAAQAEGVHACVKHFPGHGRTTTDSHAELPVVGASRQELDADMSPFRAAIAAGVRSIMMAHVSYPSLDASGTPASLSGSIVRLLREELSFDGLIATDALIMEALSASGRSPAEAAVGALVAGCDALLYPASVGDTLAALKGALESGVLSEARIEESVARVVAAAGDANVRSQGAFPERKHERALDIAASSISTLRGSLPEWQPGELIRLHIIDDDADSTAPPGVLAARPSTVGSKLAGALESWGVRIVSPKTTWPATDLVALFSEVRAWKARAGLERTTVERVAEIVADAPDAVVILFGHPRAAGQLRGAANMLCAWCGDRLMQEAAAALLMRGAPV